MVLYYSAFQPCEPLWCNVQQNKSITRKRSISKIQNYYRSYNC